MNKSQEGGVLVGIRTSSHTVAMLALAAAILAQTNDNDTNDKTGRDIGVANNSIIYDEPTGTSKRLTRLDAGETVHVIAKADGDFWEVEYGDIRGFLHDLLLTNEETTEHVSEPDLESGVYRMGSEIEPPRLLRQVRPRYSEKALTRRIQGKVILEVVISTQGTISAVKVLEGLPAGLNEAAIECVRQWKFEPGKFNGDSVDVIAEIEVEFKLLERKK